MVNNWKTPIKNWKLVEVIDSIEIMEQTSDEFISSVLKKNDLPPKYNEIMNRSESFADWSLLNGYYKFFYDYEGKEEIIKRQFSKSAFAKSQHLFITYLQDDLVIQVPTRLFIEDWEGFARSMIHNGIIVNEELNLVAEVTRDYYLHSNFEIMPESLVHD
ncbi:MAG: hypothetical protein EP338_00105 [Bacteroidetes bacterium]|nr:MAG: hypothetical protein EP338_00105 [Bacteroidota bacterium]